VVGAEVGVAADEEPEQFAVGDRAELDQRVLEEKVRQAEDEHAVGVLGRRLQIVAQLPTASDTCRIDKWNDLYSLQITSISCRCWTRPNRAADRA